MPVITGLWRGLLPLSLCFVGFDLQVLFARRCGSTATPVTTLNRVIRACNAHKHDESTTATVARTPCTRTVRPCVNKEEQKLTRKAAASCLVVALARASRAKSNVTYSNWIQETRKGKGVLLASYGRVLVANEIRPFETTTKMIFCYSLFFLLHRLSIWLKLKQKTEKNYQARNMRHRNNDLVQGVNRTPSRNDAAGNGMEAVSELVLLCTCLFVCLQCLLLRVWTVRIERAAGFTIEIPLHLLQLTQTQPTHDNEGMEELGGNDSIPFLFFFIFSLFFHLFMIKD